MAYLPKFIPLFAFICLSFYLFTCFLSFCPSLVWLPFVSPCLSSCFLVGLCILFFPYGLYAKREGAKVCPLRPLVSCCELLYLRIAAAFLSATTAALWHSWSEPKNGGMCGNSGIKAIKQSFKGCFSIFANLNDFITWKFFLSPFRFICSVPP